MGMRCPECGYQVPHGPAGCIRTLRKWQTEGAPRNYMTVPIWVRLLGPFMTLGAWITRANWYYGSDRRLHWWWP